MIKLKYFIWDIFSGPFQIISLQYLENYKGCSKTRDYLKIKLALGTQGAMQRRRRKSQRIWKTPRKGPLPNTTGLMYI